ncbi:MAG: twin-arginine translocation pathway signal protein [Novosphingobium sp.]
MKSRIAGTGLVLALLAASGNPAFAETTAASPAVAAPVAKPPLVPDDFKVPVLAEGPGFKLVPLGPALVKVDFDAYMSSIEHLQQTFSRSTAWPREGITDADAMKDMEGEQARFQARKSFAYGVLTPDGRRERGSVYVRPSPSKDYDAVVSLWVTKADYDAGFDAELYRWVTGWVQKEWPFKRVAYPGRGIDWGTWDALVAANGAKRPFGNAPFGASRHRPAPPPGHP